MMTSITLIAIIIIDTISIIIFLIFIIIIIIFILVNFPLVGRAFGNLNGNKNQTDLY